MTRVTEALDYFKTDWYTEWVLKVGKRKANATSKKALKHGTRIHEIISGTSPIDSKDSIEVKNCYKGFLAWKERYNVQTLKLLERNTDDGIGLTGEPDALWVEKDTLIDWKSSSRISPNNFLQLGGYRRLGFKCSHLGIVRLDKELGTFEYVTNDDIGLSIEMCVDAFESAFKHYLYYKQINEKLGGENG